MTEEKVYQMALSRIDGIGDVHARQLVSHAGSASAVFRLKPGRLKNIPGIGEKTASLLREIPLSQLLDQAEKELLRAEKEHVKILHFTDKEYPDRLKRIIDAPSVLYFRGNACLNPVKAVAIVGTRQATSYGRQAVEMLVDGLAKHHAQIISGLAYGIDIYAHKMAMQKNMETIAIMASGINIIYPSAHRSIASQMCDMGGLLTERRFDEKPETHNFPARNRIIAGIADAVIVIEAAERGGALITAELANEYNKDVFAIPGDLGRHYSRGCNNLIKTHKANILTSVADLEYILNWNSCVDVEVRNPAAYSEEDYTHEELKVIETLQVAGKEALIDDLSWKSQIPLNQLAGLLLNLEFKGVIRSLPGKKFRLV